MDSKRYKKHKKAREARQAPPPPLYSKGVRTDVPDGRQDKPKGKAPMDPRYPPARYLSQDEFSQGGPLIVKSPSLLPLVQQPEQKGFFEAWPDWWKWLIVALILVGINAALVLVIAWVFGEFTGDSPVYKGYFG